MPYSAPRPPHCPGSPEAAKSLWLLSCPGPPGPAPFRPHQRASLGPGWRPSALPAVGTFSGTGGRGQVKAHQGGSRAPPCLGFGQERPGLYPLQLQYYRDAGRVSKLGFIGLMALFWPSRPACLPPYKLHTLLPGAQTSQEGSSQECFPWFWGPGGQEPPPGTSPFLMPVDPFLGE